MKEIGGYFELQLELFPEYYNDLLRLNSARHCLEYILLAKKYTKIFLPHYICDVVLEPIKRHGIKFEFYNLNEELAPKTSFEIKDNEVFLYVNYFGLKDDLISQLSNTIENLIIDNSQSFFSKPLPGINTFYSPRKFFGIPDGGYLSTDSHLEYELEQDVSYDRLNHLLIRSCDSAENGYSTFKENEVVISGQSLKKMSKFTLRLLQSINYERVKFAREVNFNHLHQNLKHLNTLFIPVEQVQGPMVYPIYIEKSGVREFLITQKIFVPTYWPNVFQSCSESSLEHSLATNIVALPVDQRYTTRDMDYIINVIFGFLSN